MAAAHDAVPSGWRPGLRQRAVHHAVGRRSDQGHCGGAGARAGRGGERVCSANLAHAPAGRGSGRVQCGPSPAAHRAPLPARFAQGTAALGGNAIVVCVFSRFGPGVLPFGFLIAAEVVGRAQRALQQGAAAARGRRVARAPCGRQERRRRGRATVPELCLAGSVLRVPDQGHEPGLWWACSQTLLARLHAQLGSNPAAVAAVRDLTTLWTHLKAGSAGGGSVRAKDPSLTSASIWRALVVHSGLPRAPGACHAGPAAGARDRRDALRRRDVRGTSGAVWAGRAL